NTILQQHSKETIHFLKIDVEGAEGGVIAGINLERFRPWVMLIEALDPITQRPAFQDWEEKVLAGGYQFVYFDGLNRFYVAREHSELLSAFAAPPNVLDDFVLSSVAHSTQKVVDAKATAAAAEKRAIEAEARA